MTHIRYPRTLVLLLAAATLTAGCGATPETGSTTASSPAGSTTSSPVGQVTAAPTPLTNTPPTNAKGNHGGRGGSGVGSSPNPRQPPAAGQLPPDWPPDLPVPRGEIQGSTGSAGRWSVLIVAAGSAAQVRQSAFALYVSAGFSAVTDSILNKGNRQITLVVENLDHSATQTNLVIGVTTR